MKSLKPFLCLLTLLPSTALFAQQEFVVALEQAEVITNIVTDLTISHTEASADYKLHKIVVEDNLSTAEILEALRTNAAITNAELNDTATLDSTGDPTVLNSRSIIILDDLTKPTNGDVQPYNVYDQTFHRLTEHRNTMQYTRGAGTTVAVIDTGVDTNHSFLRNHLAQGYDFIDNDNDPNEEQNYGYVTADPVSYGHGTHVAGIIRLVAPEAQILPIRVVDSNGRAELFDVIQGIAFAVDYGVDVINLSFSLSESSPLLRSWIDEAQSRGTLVVTSAGNENTSYLNYPANIPGVVTVSSITNYGYRSDFANYGSYVDLVAPGENIISCYPGNGWAERTGTSMATPMVAAQAALLRELRPSITRSGLVRAIYNSAYSVSYLNPYYGTGNGLIDMWLSMFTY